ncbi:hypothetical protein NUW54_g5193 [Trametes sanguinea]|uniref:Uncharacterized protein n=1 Tax=Trametes sanguinea TaxID=158606 RepID=A0ACC1PVU4_9APHY|nr:hypothetical protein NUW54_g5193 [Trametes sanguinea]
MAPTLLTTEPSTPDLSVPTPNGEQQHLIVVSNRLPITITKDASGEYHFKMSSGGLVSALSGCKKSMSFTWIGWPGFFIPFKDRPLVDRRLKEEYSCQAVYLDDDVADRHYNGFSNSILWPLFHYHPGEMNFEDENWLAYRQANMAFAEAIMTQLSPGSMVWVQDYHLMLLPMLLRTLIDASSHLGTLALSTGGRLYWALGKGQGETQESGLGPERCSTVVVPGYYELRTPLLLRSSHPPLVHLQVSDALLQTMRAERSDSDQRTAGRASYCTFWEVCLIINYIL